MLISTITMLFFQLLYVIASYILLVLNQFLVWFNISRPLASKFVNFIKVIKYF